MRKLSLALGIALVVLLAFSSGAAAEPDPGWGPASGDFKTFGFCFEGTHNVFFFGNYYVTSADTPKETFDGIANSIIHASAAETRIQLEKVRIEGQSEKMPCGIGNKNDPPFIEVTGVLLTGAKDSATGK